MGQEHNYYCGGTLCCTCCVALVSSRSTQAFQVFSSSPLFLHWPLGFTLDQSNELSAGKKGEERPRNGWPHVPKLPAYVRSALIAASEGGRSSRRKKKVEEAETSQEMDACKKSSRHSWRCWVSIFDIHKDSTPPEPSIKITQSWDAGDGRKTFFEL